MFSARARSLDSNSLGGGYVNGTFVSDMSGIHKLAEALPHSQLTGLSLEDNRLGVEGCKAVAAVLDKTQITSLKCASHPCPAPDLCVDFCACLCVSSL